MLSSFLVKDKYICRRRANDTPHHNHQPKTSFVVLKIVLAGDSGVGKTEFMFAATEPDAAHSRDERRELGRYESTIGVDFKITARVVDSQQYKCQVWDTAGQERFSEIVGTYFRSAHAILLMYDSANLESFQSLRTRWLPLALRNSSASSSSTAKANAPTVRFFVVGLKSDLAKKLPAERLVPTADAQELADDIGGDFYVANSVEEGVRVHSCVRARVVSLCVCLAR